MCSTLRSSIPLRADHYTFTTSRTPLQLREMERLAYIPGELRFEVKRFYRRSGRLRAEIDRAYDPPSERFASPSARLTAFPEDGCTRVQLAVRLTPATYFAFWIVAFLEIAAFWLFLGWTLFALVVGVAMWFLARAAGHGSPVIITLGIIALCIVIAAVVHRRIVRAREPSDALAADIAEWLDLHPRDVALTRRPDGR